MFYNNNSSLYNKRRIKMENIYKAIKKEIIEGKFMREVACKTPDVEKAFEIRKQQNEQYKRTMFKKNFLIARSELNGRTK